MVWTRVLALAIAVAAVLGACSGGASKSESGGGAQPMAKAESDYYSEGSYKGRTYVLGTEKAGQAFKASNQVPTIAVTFIGAGESGETVVLEADAKNPALQERLKTEYNRRHGARLQ